MITFFGVLIALFAIVMLVAYPIFISNNQRQGNGNTKHPILFFTKKVSLGILVFGIFMILLPYLFFYAERGYNYLLVKPSGKMTAVMVQGIKFRGFAKIDPWQKYIDVKVIDSSMINTADIKELEGIMNPIPIRFIDQVTAVGYVSLRFQLPEDEQTFIVLAVKYRTMSNLVNNTIIPTVSEQLANTGYMFAAQNYISGDAQNFRQTFEEQLKFGTYAVKKNEYKDTVYSDIEMNRVDRRIKEIQTRYDVVKETDKLTGLPKRIPHELSENNISVSQVIVDNIDLERAFKKRLEAQRDESAKRQLEQQKIETAKAAQQRIVAEGERDKAQERVVQEKEQVKALIAIETKLKQEATNRDLALISLETEKINAQTVKVKADAEAYEINKKVQAGITPETELKMKLDAEVQKMAELAKVKWPENYTVILGDGTKTGSPLESIITAAMSKQLLNEKNTK